MPVNSGKTIAKPNNPTASPIVLRGKKGESNQKKEDSLQHRYKKPNYTQQNEEPPGNFDENTFH